MISIVKRNNVGTALDIERQARDVHGGMSSNMLAAPASHEQKEVIRQHLDGRVLIEFTHAGRDIVVLMQHKSREFSPCQDPCG
jgi:hypothetical protein